MDNASKALIMAGAILLAVAIVGLGVYFFSMSEGLTNQAGDSIENLSAELQNSELLKYVGDRVKGTEVQALKRKVDQIGSNWPYDLSDTEWGAMTNNKLYKVEMTVGNLGYVETITISDAA